MPIQGYAVPIEYVTPIVLGLVSALTYQSRRLFDATRRMERLHDEDRKRADMEEERNARHEQERAELERKVEDLAKANDALQESLRRARKRRPSHSHDSASPPGEHDAKSA